MIGKKINQLATELAPVSTDLTIIGDPDSGVSKKITLAQLGAIFSGAVSFYTNLAGFPAVGDINVIYCAKDTQKLYLWSGSAYTEVFPSQALLNTYQLRSEKGVSNGYASLDSGGKVPISQLPSSIMEYKGTWSAATNTPTLANGTGDTGDVYICNVAGTVNFGAGPLTFAVGDYVIYSGSIWQRSSGAVGTVTSVAATITGDAIGITGSPVTTSGTLALAFAGTTAQYIRGNGTLETFPSLTGFVPYTGATANLDLGTFDLTADIINLNQLKAVGSGGLNIYSNSGTHIALMGGGGGAGTTFYGGIIGVSASFTSSGSSDTFGITHSSGSGIALNITKGGNGEGLYINKTSGSGNAATIIGTLNATTLVKSGGTSAQFLKADGSVDSTSYGTGSVTSVGLSSATSGVTIGSTPITTSGTITLAIATASGSQQGLLSSTDWTTFNNKQSALTNPVTGTGTTNYLPKFTGASTIGDSTIQTDGTGNLMVGSANAGNAGSINVSVGVAGTTSGGLQLWAATNQTHYLQFGDGTTGASPYTGYVGYAHSTDSLIFGTATSTKMTLTSSGNLGLGVTPSAWAVTALQGPSSFSIGNQGNNGLNLLSNAYYGSNWTYITTAASSWYQQISGEHRFYNAPSGTAGNAISFTQAMTLNASGNLSIGNTNDTYKLDVSGTGRFSGLVTFNGQFLLNRAAAGNANGFALQTAGTSNWYVGSSAVGANTDLQFYNHSAAAVVFNIANTTGAATFSSSVTAANLVLNTDGVYLKNRASNVNATQFQTWHNSADTRRGYFGYGEGGANNFYLVNEQSANMYIGTNGAYNLTITSGGNVGIGTTSPDSLLQVGSTAVSSGGGPLRVYGYDGAADFYTTRQESTFNAALYLHNNPSGIVGNGTGILFRARSSSTDSRVQGAIYTSWTTSTDGSRTAKLVFQTVDSGTNSDKVTILGNGNVGIGTTTPANTLHLLGGDSSNSTLKIQASTYPIIDFISNDADSGNRNWRIASVYNAYGTFEILSSTTSGGTPLTTRFSINGITGAATFSGSVKSSGLVVLGSNSSTTPYALGSSAPRFQLMNGGVYGLAGDVLTNGNTYLQSQQTDGNTAAYNLLLQPLGGNVGIGTTSPGSSFSELLQVSKSDVGRISVTHTNTTGSRQSDVLFTENATLQFQVGTILGNGGYDDQNWIRGVANIPLVFHTNSVERMRITSGGSVLIGTTTEGFLGKLQVAGSVAITGQYNTVLPSSSFSYFDGSGQVVSSSSNASALYLDTTWNTTGNPDGIYLNVTNTASGASSKLLNLKVGSVSQFSVSKAGAIQTTAPSSGSAQPWKLGSYAAGGTGTATGVIYIEVNGQIYSIPALLGTP